MTSFLSHEGLYWGARKFAHSAMDANARHDEEVFLLHAGVSIERLAKAVLTKISPFLLMEMRGNDDTLFHLAGVKKAAKVRTAGAAQAISRLRAINLLPQKDLDLDELIELRNGVAHLDVDMSESFDVLATFARVSNALLPHLEKDTDSYWGEWLSAIEIALSEVLERVVREVSGRIEQARYRLGERLRGVPEDAVAIIYENANAGADAGGFGIRAQCGVFTIHSPRECPACRCTGHLFVNIPGVGATPEGDATRGFACPLCSFDVYGNDELAAAGISPKEPLLDGNGNPLVTLDTSSLDTYIQYGMVDASGVSGIARFIAAQAATADGIESS